MSDRTKISVLRYTGALLLTLAFGALLVVCQGESPAKVIVELFRGAFGSKVNACNVLHWFASCTLVGLAAAIAFKSGVINMGIEGQLYMGAWVAAVIGYKFALPSVVHPVVCILAGGLMGLLWGLIPALLRLIFRIDEVITTLMMNFIAKLFTEYLTTILLRMEGITNMTTLRTPKIASSAELTVLFYGTSATTAIFIALFMGILLYLLYRHTIKGYELKQVGENLRFSKIGGVNASRTFITIFLLTSFVGGVAGAVEILGVNHQFIVNFSANMGWDGIMIARVAANNPLSVLVVSLFWSIFKTGSLSLERATLINRYVINTLQALLVIFLSVDYRIFYDKYMRIKMRSHKVDAGKGGV